MSLNINNSLTYSLPQSMLDGDVTFTSFKPSSGPGLFLPNDTISVKLSSNTDFFVPERSYIKFNLRTTAIGNLSVNGAYQVIQNITDNIGGSVILARNVHHRNGVKLQTATSEKKAIDTFAAGCIFTSGTGLAVTASTDLVVCIPFQSAIDTSKIIPLSVINGYEISYALNPAANVVSAGTYDVRNFEIIACLLTPNQKYLEELSRGLMSGSSMKIPVELSTSTTISVSSALVQNLIVNTGYLGSLNTLTFVHKESALANAAKVSSYFVLLDSQRYPRNKEIVGLAEQYYQALAGYSTHISTLSVPDTTQTFNHYSWKSNEEFASGVPCANGALELALTFSSTPTGFVEVITSYDAYLDISRNAVTLITDV